MTHLKDWDPADYKIDMSQTLCFDLLNEFIRSKLPLSYAHVNGVTLIGRDNVKRWYAPALVAAASLNKPELDSAEVGKCRSAEADTKRDRLEN